MRIRTLAAAASAKVAVVAVGAAALSPGEATGGGTASIASGVL